MNHMREVLETQDALEQRHLVGEFVGILLALPACLGGVLWLLAATDLAVARDAWAPLLAALAFSVLLSRAPFHWIIEREGGGADSASSTLSSLAHLSATLLFGPTALWVYLLSVTVSYTSQWRAQHATTGRLNLIRNYLQNIGVYVLGALIGLALYQRLGGAHPPAPWPGGALLALIVVGAVAAVRWLWLAVVIVGAHRLGMGTTHGPALRRYLRFAAFTVLPDAFAVLAAVIYAQVGPGAYLVLLLGALLVSRLAHRLSQAVEQRAQRSRELEQLEQLGRALLSAPPDASALPAVLAAHVPPMFRHRAIEIRVAGQPLLRAPADAPALPDAAWADIGRLQGPRIFGIGSHLPWDTDPLPGALAVAPLGQAAPEVSGGVALVLAETVGAPDAVLPALQSLAAQVAAALRQAELHAQDLARQRMAQELAVAGQIQQSLLPRALPALPGWQISAALRPARETSGDFYDLIPLPGARLGLLIADVADKGTGAALIMTLCRTLLRTYAPEHADRPDRLLAAVNRRLIAETDSQMFVTLFYGVLEPATGRLCFGNAGHNPPLLLRHGGGPAPELLTRTGIPLGIEADLAWTMCEVVLESGDLLVLYTDGVTEAEDVVAAPFGMDGLLAAAEGRARGSAEQVSQGILDAVAGFVGDAPQADDLTLVVVARERTLAQDAG